MNLDQFYSEFNLAYNNLASNQAAGLTPYEISVYLTKAQNTLVDSIYEQFENSEEARRKLAVLVVTLKLSQLTINSNNFIYPEYTVAFNTPADLRYIVNEQLKMSDKAGRCVRDKYIDVVPVSHDEVDRMINNPFKFNNRKAFRLDTSLNDSVYIEILTKDTNVSYYQIRYIKNPKPIILEDLVGTDEIDGMTTAQDCLLPESLHRQIIEIAAKMAYQDYKI